MTKTKLTSVLLAIFLALSLSSCYTLDHTVGKGAQGSEEHEKRVWYALWGLIPITDFDSKDLAGDAQNYTIKSEMTFLDLVIGIFTTIVTIQPQTVVVTK
jgi:hypothetical protein